MKLRQFTIKKVLLINFGFVSPIGWITRMRETARYSFYYLSPISLHSSIPFTISPYRIGRIVCSPLLFLFLICVCTSSGQWSSLAAIYLLRTLLRRYLTFITLCACMAWHGFCIYSASHWPTLPCIASPRLALAFKHFPRFCSRFASDCACRNHDAEILKSILNIRYGVWST